MENIILSRLRQEKADILLDPVGAFRSPDDPLHFVLPCNVPGAYVDQKNSRCRDKLNCAPKDRHESFFEKQEELSALLSAQASTGQAVLCGAIRCISACWSCLKRFRRVVLVDKRTDKIVAHSAVHKATSGRQTSRAKNKKRKTHANNNNDDGYQQQQAPQPPLNASDSLSISAFHC